MDNRSLLMRAAGILLVCGGLLLLVQQSEFRADAAGIFSVFLILSGIIVFIASLFIKELRRKTAFEISVRRRAFLFSLLVMVYSLTAGTFLLRAMETGRDVQRISIQTGIGAIAVLFAYVLLIRQMLEERRKNRIQDAALGDLPVYANGRMFTMVIEESSFESNDPEGALILSGVLHGEVQKNDTVWIIDQGIAHKTAVLAVKTDGSKTEITVPNAQKPKGNYAVITSLISYRYVDSETPVSNPELFALIQGSRDPIMNMDYLSHLIYVAAHSRYLVRVTELKRRETLFSRFTAWLFGPSGFYIPEVVSRKNDSIRTYACYSDWNAFHCVMKNVRENERKSSRAMILTFQQIADNAKKAGADIIINPFGPSSFCISNKLLSQMMESEKYQKEFPLENSAKPGKPNQSE